MRYVQRPQFIDAVQFDGQKDSIEQAKALGFFVEQWNGKAA